MAHCKICGKTIDKYEKHIEINLVERGLVGALHFCLSCFESAAGRDFIPPCWCMVGDCMEAVENGSNYCKKHKSFYSTFVKDLKAGDIF